MFVHWFFPGVGFSTAVNISPLVSSNYFSGPGCESPLLLLWKRRGCVLLHSVPFEVRLCVAFASCWSQIQHSKLTEQLSTLHQARDSSYTVSTLTVRAPRWLLPGWSSRLATMAALSFGRLSLMLPSKPKPWSNASSYWFEVRWDWKRINRSPCHASYKWSCHRSADKVSSFSIIVCFIATRKNPWILY